MHHRVDLPDWAVARGRVLNEVTRLVPAATALVVIDMQNVFLAPGEVFGNPYALGIVPRVNRAVAAFREAGATILWTRQTVDHTPPRAMPAWQYDLSIPEVRAAVEAMVHGTRSHALHDAMEPAAGDLVIDKYRYGAFSCPEGALERALAEHSIDTILIVGTLTNCCCDSTAREANMRGLRVLLLSDATAAASDAEHNAALLLLRLNFADICTTDEAIRRLQGPA